MTFLTLTFWFEATTKKSKSIGSNSFKPSRHYPHRGWLQLGLSRPSSRAKILVK